MSHSNKTNMKNDFQLPCQYSQKLKSFSCQVEILEGDKIYHVVSLCVSNSVGSKSSANVAFQSLNMGKQVPEPPAASFSCRCVPDLLLGETGRCAEGLGSWVF